jgi:hypothetical protein
MTKKITLTVNESLFRKIDAWRSSFNLSRLFQVAVSEAISRKEEFQAMLSGRADIPKIVERLKAEKRRLLDVAGKAGEADGSSWAGRAHYDELLSEIGACGGDAGAGPSAEARRALEAWEARYALAGMDGKEGGVARAAYLEGWRAGVRGLWDLVKDRLGDE